MHAEQLETGERLALLLVARARLVDLRLRKALGETGIRPRHAQVLKLLASNGPMSQQAILEAMEVDPSVLVAILNDLERDGLAERRRDSADRRRHIVAMSRRGAAALRKMERTITSVEGELFAELDATDRARLADLLERVGSTCVGAAAECITVDNC